MPRTLDKDESKWWNDKLALQLPVAVILPLMKPNSIASFEVALGMTSRVVNVTIVKKRVIVVRWRSLRFLV